MIRTFVSYSQNQMQHKKLDKIVNTVILGVALIRCSYCSNLPVIL